MIVVDASGLLEFLLQTPLGIRLEARLFETTRTSSVRPTLRTLKSLKASAVSYGPARCHLTGRPRPLRTSPTSISTGTPTFDLLTRAWKVRENVTAYRRHVRDPRRGARCAARHLRHAAREGAESPGARRSDRVTCSTGEATHSWPT